MSELDKNRTPEADVKRAAVPRLERNKKSISIPHALAKYFNVAVERLNFLEYGDPSEYLLRNYEIETAKSYLNSIWVAPKFRTDAEAGEEISIETLLADKKKCQLILADPGCGKSTLSRYITCYLIEKYFQGEEEYFGLYIPLSLINLSGKTYQEAVAYCAAKYVGLENDIDVITEIKRNLSRACIIFDGYDELPVTSNATTEKDFVTLRKDVASLIRSLLFVETNHNEEQNPKRILVTCRTKDYYEDRGSNIASIPLYFMAKFSPPQMNLAISKWHEAAKAKLSLISSKDIVKFLDERRLGIESALREHSDLASLCLTPLMLTALLTVYSDKNDLPSSVSQLTWRAINWFFIDKHSKTSQDTFVKKYGPWLLESIIEIGWTVHEHFVTGKPKVFDNNELRKLVRQANKSREFLQADYDTQEDSITKVASFIRKGHGILVQVSNSEYDFVHNVFREVLAGKLLGKLSVPERLTYALNSQWIGPIRYWAGLRAVDADGMHEIGAFVGELSEEVGKRDLSATIASGEMLAEVCLIVPKQKLTRDLKNHIGRIREELYSLLKVESVSIGLRVRIGDLLAALGDSRLANSIQERVITIDEANYTIGRNENHKTRIAKYEKCPASPQIKGHLKRFKIGTYLVTNADYHLFILANGYLIRKYWKSDLGWKWAQGNEETIQELISRARGVASLHLASELAGQRIIKDEIPEHCVQMIKRKLPLYWQDRSYNRPNQPVVGINWWEADAFCNWLDEKLKAEGVLSEQNQVRIPTEAEWEVTARLAGSGEKYPWIEGLPADNALVRVAFNKGTEVPIQRSCGVGLFKFVKTSFPIFDLVGNVWEWTASKVHHYSKETFNQIIDEKSFDDRISRGSSWLSSEEESTQITFRSFDPPYNAYEDLGFRIVII